MKTLFEKTLDYLHDNPAPYAMIAEEAGCSVRALYKIRDGEVTDPGVNVVQSIHDACVRLKRKKIKVYNRQKKSRQA